MTGPSFVDTNVLVYARDLSEPEKQPLAAAWMKRLWEERSGRLSAQVLGEFYVTVTRKLRPGMKDDEARAEVRSLMRWKPAAINEALFETAWRSSDRFRITWWDALIVAAAKVQGCRSLLSEDFQDGQDLDGLVVVNPFRHAP